MLVHLAWPRAHLTARKRAIKWSVQKYMKLVGYPCQTLGVCQIWHGCVNGMFLASTKFDQMVWNGELWFNRCDLRFFCHSTGCFERKWKKEFKKERKGRIWLQSTLQTLYIWDTWLLFVLGCTVLLSFHHFTGWFWEGGHRGGGGLYIARSTILTLWKSKMYIHHCNLKHWLFTLNVAQSDIIKSQKFINMTI